MSDQTAIRLRDLANDCEERARLSSNDDARGLYRLAARNARNAASAGYLTADQRRAELSALAAVAGLARWHDGEPESAPFVRPSEGLSNSYLPKSADLLPLPADKGSESALNARQLASLYPVNERTARRAIERGVIKGLPGFYRSGWQWLADREAFERVQRGRVSELCPNDSAGLGQRQ